MLPKCLINATFMHLAHMFNNNNRQTTHTDRQTHNKIYNWCICLHLHLHNITYLSVLHSVYIRTTIALLSAFVVVKQSYDSHVNIVLWSTSRLSRVACIQLCEWMSASMCARVISVGLFNSFIFFSRKAREKERENTAWP